MSALDKTTEARELIIDALVMTKLSDYAGDDMRLIENAADKIIEKLDARVVALEAEPDDVDDGTAFDLWANQINPATGKPNAGRVWRGSPPERATALRFFAAGRNSRPVVSVGESKEENRG